MNQRPSVGRIVHYVSYGTPKGEYTSQCRAAIITAVEELQNMKLHKAIKENDPDATNIGWVVSLCVLNPNGFFFNEMVMQDEFEKPGGTWHWCEKI